MLHTLFKLPLSRTIRYFFMWRPASHAAQPALTCICKLASSCEAEIAQLQMLTVLNLDTIFTNGSVWEEYLKDFNVCSCTGLQKLCGTQFKRITQTCCHR